MARWESVIGLEVHVQLNTVSKIFSGAGTVFGEPPNTQACTVDLALPGVLPVLNAEVVRQAVLFGLAVGGEIAERCRFDRKNYFYPDLPKGYQISQLDEPIVRGGHLMVDADDGGLSCEGQAPRAPRLRALSCEGQAPRAPRLRARRRIDLTRAHLEEDAGKSLHEDYAGLTGIDLNRAGTPLLEVVSEPQLTSPGEAAAYFRAMHALVRYLGICDGDLSQGSMRCDANVSVRRPGAPLGERTEIKNLNSFRFLEKALVFEIDRQIDILESGGAVDRETLLYDAERDETRPMRGKELSDDYRYFPDPDLLPVVVTQDLLAEVRATLPELPDAKRERFQRTLGLDDRDARWLVADPDRAAYFEAVVEACGQAKAAANWLMGDVAAALNRDGRPASMIPVPAGQLAKLIERTVDETVSGKIAKSLFDMLWSSGEGDVDDLIAEHGLKQVSDDGALTKVVADIVAANPAQAAQYRGGQAKLLGFFVGQVMKATRGKANPRKVNELLREHLDSG